MLLAQASFSKELKHADLLTALLGVDGSDSDSVTPVSSPRTGEWVTWQCVSLPQCLCCTQPNPNVACRHDVAVLPGIQPQGR